jgi:cytochrome c oxidase cbb3-type subunit III
MKKKLFIISSVMLSALEISAQNAAAPATGNGISQMITDPMTYIIIMIMVILLATILVMSRVIRLLTWQLAGSPKPVEKPAAAAAAAAVAEKKATVWTKINHWLSDSVPVEKEADVLLDHDYDGIKELDNNLPPWWKYGFYLTIIFSVIYMAHYHVVGSGNVQLDEYQAQLDEAAKQKEERLKLAANEVDENTATMMLAEADLSAGKKIYVDKCLVCHGGAGEGLVGPNLTDDYWIHGGSIKDVFKIVKYGFPSKGMLAWQGQLTPVQMQQVSSYVKSLHGTNPPNPKEPQGDLYKEVAESAEQLQLLPILLQPTALQQPPEYEQQ